MRSNKSELLFVIRDIGVGIGTIIALFLSVTQLGQLFGINLDWASALGIYGVYLIGIHALLGGLIYSTVMYIRRWMSHIKGETNLEQSEVESANKLSFELAKVVEENHRVKNYVEVVRFGSQLSRPLWLSGMYKERIIIGELVEDSAPRVGMYEEQITALIDDTGWTNAVLGNIEKAEQHISDGIKLAAEKSLFYYAAKGERHLAGIYQRYKNDFQKASEHFNRAIGFADKIQDELDKQEMRAGILFGQADVLTLTGQYNQALNSAIQSREIYEIIGGQEERLAKSISQIGRIHLGLNELQKAKDNFRVGLEQARQLRRRDEIACNLLGLGEVYFRIYEYNRAHDVLREAMEIFEEMGMKCEAHKSRDLMGKAKSLKTNPNHKGGEL